MADESDASNVPITTEWAVNRRLGPSESAPHLRPDPEVGSGLGGDRPTFHMLFTRLSPLPRIHVSWIT